jgi:glutaredoxin
MKRSHGRHGANWRLAAALLGLALLVIADVAAGQVYKWKDEHGVTHYGDTPPPRAKSEVLTTAKPAPPRAPVLPYELARAVQAAPVVLYTTARCDGCDQGRALLRTRGIPYAERSVDSADDERQLEQASGGKRELPLLQVGSRSIAGFQVTAWQEALTSAAYPRQSMLPPSYQFAAPVPAAGSTAARQPVPPATPPKP